MALVTEWILRRHHLASVVLLAVCFFPLCWISQYNYPSGDDYAAFHQAQSLGTLRATSWWYFNWTGRYTSFLLQSAFPQHATWLLAYTVIPIVLLVAGFGCLFSFAKAFFGSELPTRDVLTITACGYTFLISLTPDVATGFYWLPSNVQYVGAVFITLLVLALYIRLEAATAASTKGLLAAVLVFLIACLAGLNEISVLLLIGILALVCWFQFFKRNRRPTFGLLLLSASVLFAMLSFMAPGNAVRATQGHRASELMKAQVSAIGLTAYLLFHLLSVTPLLLVSGLYLAFLQRRRERLGHLFVVLADLRWYWVLVFFLAGLTVINALLFTAGGIHLTERVENVYVFSIVLIWFFLLTVVFVNAAGGPLRFSIPGWLWGVMGVSVILFLVTGFRLHLRRHDFVPETSQVQKAFTLVRTRSVFANAYLDILSGRAARYAAQNEETTRRFRAAQGGCVEFPPLSYVPETLFIHVKYPWTWCPAEYMKSFGELSP